MKHHKSASAVTVRCYQKEALAQYSRRSATALAVASVAWYLKKDIPGQRLPSADRISSPLVLSHCSPLTPDKRLFEQNV